MSTPRTGLSVRFCFYTPFLRFSSLASFFVFSCCHFVQAVAAPAAAAAETPRDAAAAADDDTESTVSEQQQPLAATLPAKSPAALRRPYGTAWRPSLIACHVVFICIILGCVCV